MDRRKGVISARFTVYRKFGSSGETCFKETVYFTMSFVLKAWNLEAITGGDSLSIAPERAGLSSMSAKDLTPRKEGRKKGRVDGTEEQTNKHLLRQVHNFQRYKKDATDPMIGKQSHHEKLSHLRSEPVKSVLTVRFFISDSTI